jgi:pimeloyl-ACP methyl ester carboxylesterase
LSKPHVLFIHGAGGGGWEWNIWSRVFKAHGFHVHAPDLLPTHLNLAETALHDYAKQMEDHLHAMPSPKVMMGASLGGLLAMMNAKHAHGLILINPMPPAPWHMQMPVQEIYPPIIPWRSLGTLESTRKALPDADALSVLYAFAHWRDESGAVMNSAYKGVELDLPSCATLFMASENDKDVPFSVSKNLAQAMQAKCIALPSTSHIGALLGKNANHFAVQAVGWLNSIFSQD